MSFTPEELATAIRAHLPDFTIDYEVDAVRQAIADSWPESSDDGAARSEWDWKPAYDLEAMTAEHDESSDDASHSESDERKGSSVRQGMGKVTLS